ncbi:MAG: virulence RhuM family protein [Bacteroidetes bacterium]|nr:virulence RhuM family protein [Bacteroidota bacterium]
MKEVNKNSDFILYNSDDGTIKVQVILEDETVWLTQKAMGELFGVVKSTISEHLSNIYQSGEIDKDATVREFRTVQTEGSREVERSLEYYNLDAIISVGYRVNSHKATRFRQWATKTLREYLTKGFVLDDERLKQGTTLFGKDYFSELLERIREIRASERRFYQKVTDLYATAIDYDPQSPITQTFYATVQNKLHWAIHRHTAAELIAERADSTKPNMGLTSWKAAKKGGKVIKSDVSVAKNYLSEEEVSGLNRIVSMYLDYGENMAARNKALTMKEWAEKLDAFLSFNEYDVLKDAGKVSKAIAKRLAEEEYKKFRIIQDQQFESDFDKAVDKIKETGELPTGEETEELSDFNKNLKRALDFDPKGKKK